MSLGSKLAARRGFSSGLDWIDIFRRHSDSALSLGSFANTAQLNRMALPSSQLAQIDNNKATLVAKYKFPIHLSTSDDREVDLSTVLMVFDEISSWAFFSADRTKRPGVSVNLSAYTHNKPMPHFGDECLVVTRVAQCGKTLGFANIELQRPSGEVLVSGQHIKYLPMPRQGILPWDILFAPSMEPLSRFVMKRILADQKTRAGSTSGETSVADWTSSLNPVPGSKGSFDFVSGHGHCNGVGTTHGGCQVMLAEAAMRRALGCKVEVKSVNSTYLGAHRRGPMLIAVKESAKSLTSPSGVVEVSISDPKTAKVLTEVRFVI